MPELPEVETIKNQLHDRVVGKRIRNVFFHPDYGNTLKFRNKKDIEKLLIGKEISDIQRYGKYLFFNFSDSSFLLFHLKIYGRLVINPEFTPPKDHVHRLSLILEDGQTLRLFDKSNLAVVLLISPEELKNIQGRIAPDPFDLTGEEFHRRIISAKQTKIKETLLNQGLISGIGNIYADESLYKAHISPFRKSFTLSKDESKNLLEATTEALKQGIRNRGTSIESYYDTFGVPGENQKYLEAYGRNGQPCLVCRNPITLTEIGGRRTYFCPFCQPESQLSLF